MPAAADKSSRKRIVVTGGAGFVGSNLSERLLADGHSVTVIDDLSGGSRRNLAECSRHDRFRFVEQTLLDLAAITSVMSGQDAVFHLAANSNIPEGRRSTDMDLKLGTLATYNVLEAMRMCGIREIAFSSSSVVYGEPSRIPTQEDYGPLFPISLYGASKLACEGLISAYCHNYNFQAWIYRFANICGRHGTHGVILDFIRKLHANSRRLEILGDGRQAKPYLHVRECVDAMLHIWTNARTDALNFFNLGCEGATATDRIAELLLEAMGLKNVEIIHGVGERGWPGDVPQVRLDCGKLEKFGWKAKLFSDDAVRLAVRELLEESACRQSS